MKKALCVLAVLIALLAQALTGCGSTNTQPPSDNTAASSSEEASSTAVTEGGFDPAADTFPIVTEPVTLKVLALGARVEIEDWNTNEVTKYWEDKTGVKFQWDTITDVNASRQKLGVVMASGDLPDIIFSGSAAMTQDQAVSYGAQGLLVAMNDLIDKYGVNTKKLYEYDPNVEKAITAPDGKIYFLPSYTSNAMAHTSLMQRCLVNTKWLDNLNLEVPTTTDEFYEMLRAFKENDANGNGDASDEIPLVTWKSNYTGFDTYLMNSFQFNSGKLYNWLMVEDGSILACYTQPGWQEGLKYMRRLYEEGLADKEIILTTNDQLKMYTGDTRGNRVGAALTYSYSSFINLTSEVINEFSFIPPLKGPGGVQQSPYVGSWVDPGYFITAACEQPDVAFRLGDAMMLDALSDPTLKALEGIYGPEGKGWAKAEGGEVGLDGTTPAKYKWLFTFGQPNNLNWHEYGLIVRRADWKLLMVADQSEWNQEAILYKAAMEQYKPYMVDKVVPSSLIFETDKVAEVSQLKETINTYVEESISKFVTGTTNIHTDWNAYIEQLNKLGLERFLSLYQEAYDRQYKD